MPMSSGTLQTGSVRSGYRLRGVKPAAERDALPPLYQVPTNSASRAVTPSATVDCGGIALLDLSEGRGGAALLHTTAPS